MFLTPPGVASALGHGLAAHLHALMNAQASDTLCESNQWLADRTLWVGQYQESYHPWPETIPEQLRSRNNALLCQALWQIDSHIQHAIARYGADRIAVVMGTSTTGSDENIPAYRRYLAGEPWSEVQFSQAHQMLCAPADLIAQHYGLHNNACYGISTACTSGARALISAARLLRANMCDAVICGGVDTLSMLTINGFASLEVLSQGIARPFASTRDGINIGEAAAVFVMSREPSAVALCGYGASSDAWHMSSPHPEGKGAELAMRQALEKAQIDVSTVGWLNAHGTGTRLNDDMEAAAIERCLGQDIPVTSTKPLTGHTLGAAGALEAAILWMVIDRQLNPQGRLPSQRMTTADAPSDLPIRLSDEQSHWPSGRRVGMSTSFAFGGNNTALILGEVC
ncbi:beta-ketoacyl-ACP synthase [Suttonella sp. R2A3]|uniref:beta-ketoacyl-ACP synthase n=1 Tax=Suttonella sp. R2A3 TaxID=2908648 RepID=UPI001F452258|nr:beta-ketoacyl-ACP synthase [Suttonella sp. R2A3]UJF25442.1 beta-ketoacyl-ACP synthase [Suttonella sp. R2A3]